MEIEMETSESLCSFRPKDTKPSDSDIPFNTKTIMRDHDVRIVLFTVRVLFFKIWLCRTLDKCTVESP